MNHRLHIFQFGVQLKLFLIQITKPSAASSPGSDQRQGRGVVSSADVDAHAASTAPRNLTLS